jgi:hypothetical protein
MARPAQETCTMARSLIPDPLELLRQAVNRLEGKANSLAGRGLEIDQVVKTLHQVSTVSLALRQAFELALDNFYKRLNLPTGREFAAMSAALQRIEDRLERLSMSGPDGSAQPRPARTRRPPAAAPAVARDKALPARKKKAAAKQAATTARPRRRS